MLKSLIRRWSSFTYLNITQFLGALNDNIYKLLIVYFFIQIEGLQYSHQILATTGAIFVLPFILFSASSGTLADRFSKRNIIVLTKIFELLIMILAVFAFHYESKLGSYCILFLLAAQSALFGPSKYGIIPELVSSDQISKANGLMSSFTFLAIIFGTFLASFLLDITDKNFIISSIFCTVVALVGLITSLCIPYTHPAGSRKSVNLKIISDVLASLKIAKKEVSLLAAVFGSAFFLFLGAFIQLNMIPFAVQSLHLTDVQGGYLFLLTALGIGSGAMLAGRLSGKIVELGIVPIAALGVTICCFLLEVFPHSLITVIPLIMLLGLFGGMYQIPLDSFIQVTSPNQFRGQIVGATNFLSFIGVLFSSALIYLLGDIFALSANKNFGVIGTITLVVMTIMTFQFFDYITRLVGALFGKLHFRVTYSGVENIPSSAAIYVCTHTAWNDTLLLLGAQRHRMRFFIEHEKRHSKWMRRLYRLLRVFMIPPIESLENNQICHTVIKNTLKKEISVCIFVDNYHVEEEIEKLKQSESFQQILEETKVPVVPVTIKKGFKCGAPLFFARLWAKFRVPATLTFGAAMAVNSAASHSIVPEHPCETCVIC